MRLAACTALLFTCLLGATADTRAEVWEVEEFQIVPEPPGVEIFQGTGWDQLSAISDAYRMLREEEIPLTPAIASAQSWANEVGRHYREANFPPPDIEPIRTYFGVPRYTVYFFNTATNGYSGACPRGSSGHRSTVRMSSLTSGGLLPESWYWGFAHEVMHSMQNATPYGANCKETGIWSIEGLADGAGRYLFEHKFPGRVGSTMYNFSASGLRDYSQSLVVEVDKQKYPTYSQIPNAVKRNGYLSGSFWFFLQERFGGLEVLRHFLESPVSKHPPREEHLKWFEERANSLPQPVNRQVCEAGVCEPLNRGLYEIYPHFITEFASYGGARYQNFAWRKHGSAADARKTWLDESLGGCFKIVLDPTTKVDRVPFAMQPNSALCFHVTYQGFSGAQTTDVEVLSADLPIAEQLHLGWAWKLGPDIDENCYQKRKAFKSKWTPCVLKKKVQTGPKPAQYAQTWGQEYLDFGSGTQGSAERYFILSNVAPRPWTTKELTALEFKVGVNTVVVNNQPGLPVGPLPARRRPGVTKPVLQLGDIDKEVLYGLETAPKTPADGTLGFTLSPYTAGRNLNSPAATAGGYAVQISDIRYGQTGAVKGIVALQASDPANEQGPVSSILCAGATSQPIGEVTQSDEDALVVSVDTDLCQGNPQTCGSGGCPVVDHLTASVDMAFGWRQFQETAPTDIRTPGIARYIDTMPDTLAEALQRATGAIATELEPTSTGPGSTDGQGTDSSASGAAIGTETCACSCEEKNRFDERSAVLKNDPSVSEEAKLREINSFMGCFSQCQREYMICTFEAADEARSAELAARAAAEQSRAESCDCSCAGMSAFDRRAQELNQRATTGQVMTTEDLMQLTTCAKTCQGEYLSCRMEQFR